LTLLCALFLSHPIWAKPFEITFNEVAVSIDVRDGADVRDLSPKLDFLLYEVVASGKTIVTLYVGNAPQVPDPPKDAFRKIAVAGCEAYALDSYANGSLIPNKNVLVLLRPEGGAPQVIRLEPIVTTSSSS
jgi:hypothetical protein